MPMSAKIKDILIDVAIVLGVLWALNHIVPAKWRTWILGGGTPAA